MRTYAIGDVHGLLLKLQELIGLCRKDAGQKPLKLILLGDYIDRGPDSRGVIEYLMALQHATPENVICLMGNHEDMLLAALDDKNWEESWLNNGGVQTLRSYGAVAASDLPKDHIDWIRKLPKFYDDGLRFFVHAGVDPERALDRQDDYDLLTIREPFLSSIKAFGRLVVHGHTPLRDGKPDVRANRINLDTAAVYGGPLTAAKFRSNHTKAITFLSSQR